MPTEQEIETVYELIRRKKEVINELKHAINMLQSIDDKFTEVLGNQSLLTTLSGLGITQTTMQTSRDLFRNIKDWIKGKSL